MNPRLNHLQPYPFQRLRNLLQGITPNPAYSHINLSIGEPKHDTPEMIKQALSNHLSGLSTYPTTAGLPVLRQAIATWLQQRYQVPVIDSEKAILPVNGSREALFAIAQTVVDNTTAHTPIVISPNPFYQIYEGAALLAGAQPYFINATAQNGFTLDLCQVPVDILQRTQLVYVCSPGNPSGKVLSLQAWQHLFDYADKYQFTIASDECYSEIYFDEAQPPLGAMQAAHLLGRDFKNLVVFSSLSKRSNVPGMRSGFVAGDSQIIEKFSLYRTYHGCAMSPAVQMASITAWQDEVHVKENRNLYREKFAQITPILKNVWSGTSMPDAAFYLWINTQQDDCMVVKKLFQHLHITVLPGSFLARDAHGHNPGKGYIRIALVASLDDCLEAAGRISANSHLLLN